MKPILKIVLVQALLFFSCQPIETPPPLKEDAGETPPPLKGDVDRGQIVFTKECSVCHYSNRKPFELAKKDAEKAVETIRQGREYMMPSFQGRLTDQEIADVVAFLNVN